jgi:hypothetical protein
VMPSSSDSLSSCPPTPVDPPWMIVASNVASDVFIVLVDWIAL